MSLLKGMTNGLVALGLIVAVNAVAKEKKATTATETGGDLSLVVVVPVKVDERIQAEMASTLAVHGLNLVAEARTAIQAKDQAKATDLLTRANAAFTAVEQHQSNRLKDYISIARRHIDLGAALADADLVPIYGEVTKITDTPTRTRWNAAVDRVKEFFHAGNREAAKNQLAKLDEAIVVKRVELPVVETKQQVATALEQVKAKEFKKADATLANAENGLRVQVTAFVSALPNPPEVKKGE